ncbi:MAG: hypothetical protein KA264_02605 [Crocinitomicaceae bacterium]|nr:hypothetical protein [Crocinitomicaceae bacterium]
MNEVNKYIDENGVEITIEKRGNYPFVREIYSENGIKKHQKIYDNGKLSNISFYAYSSNEIDVLVKNKKSVSVIFIYFNGVYEIKEYLDYFKNKLIEKRISVSDKLDNLICFRIYKLDNSILIPIRTDKSYFVNEVQKYSFEYNEDGTIFMIYDEEFDEKIYPSDIGVNPNETFTWESFEYYKCAEPLIPVN